MTYQSLAPTEDCRPIRDIAYEQLKHAIITGEIPAGSRIVETAYAEKLHISRTPLREALRKLERDGLVEYVLHRGVLVRAFTINDIDEIFTIRNAMMMLLLPSIVERITQEDIDRLAAILKDMDVAERNADVERLAIFNRSFHNGMEKISDKRRVRSVLDSQEEYIMRFSAIAIAGVVRRTNAHQEHHQMLTLLEKRDLDGLMKLMNHHLEESKTACLHAVKGKVL